MYICYVVVLYELHFLSNIITGWTSHVFFIHFFCLRPKIELFVFCRKMIQIDSSLIATKPPQNLTEMHSTEAIFQRGIWTIGVKFKVYTR